MRLATSLGAGFLIGLGVASLPASAADAVIAADSNGTNSTWQPNSATINPGESVTWTNDGGFHNVCVQKPGAFGSACDEFGSGAASTTWTSISHQFTAAGTYAFFCTVHKAYGMTGTITVQGASTGPGTGTNTPPATQPTDTSTAPTQTQTQGQAQTQTQTEMQTQGETTPADVTAPSFTGKLKRRASRRALMIELGSSEAATLQASVFLRPLHRRSSTRISQASLKVKPGRNVVTLVRKPKASLGRGSYRVKLQLVDPSGNKSRAKTLSFKLA
jgi:plastocyanin